MTRSLLLLPLAFLPFGPAGGQPPTATPATPAGFQQVQLNGHTFTLPVGFTIELAAGADVVPRPIAAAFDERGRLYVTDSSGSNEKVQDQLAKKPHRVLRLTDSDGDGKYESSTVFVPNVMLPQGAMWLTGSLYVAAPPHILKFTDTNDDGRADKEEVWFDGKTLTGCANDLHGPCLGPDGWVYWCKGAFAKQEYTLRVGDEKRPFVTRASHVFRARPDGTDIQPVMTGGMDNPVDLVFTPTGDRVFSCTFLQHPRDGKRDGLIHAVPGALYGKPHDVLDGHVRTHPELMPPMTHLGPAAPCGLHRYESDQFGPAYANNLFCCQFNLRKVSRHILVPAGSTYTTTDSDFLASDNHDFHPTDVIEDADGSLLVIDTGGWYKLCCPTSQLVKPDVTGAIYRVRKSGAHQVDDPRGLKIDWAKRDAAALGQLLHDPRPAVAGRVVVEAERRGREVGVAAAALTTDGTRAGRLRAAWLAAREGRSGAQRFIAGLADSPDEDVRLIALHMIGTDHVEGGYGQGVAAERLADPSPRVRRVAAECLTFHGRHSAEAERVFAALAVETNDRPLDHALTLLLIEGVERDHVAKGLVHPSPRVRRAVLTALDQRPDGKLDPAAVLRELDGTDAALVETAWWIAGRHPEWGDRLAGHFRERLGSIEKLTPPEQDSLVNRAVPFLKGEPVRRVLGDALAKAAAPAVQRPLLRGMARAGLKTFPPEWREGVQLALFSADTEVVRDAAAVLRAAPPTAEVDALLTEEVWRYRLRNKVPTPPEIDMVIRAATPLGARLTADQALAAIDQLHRDRFGPARAAAADLLSRAPLPTESLVLLAGALKTMPPAEVGRVLPAFDRSTDAKVGLAFVAALSEPAVRPVIRAEQVKPTLDKYPPPVRAAADRLYALLAEARGDEVARLEALLKELPEGDVRRGQAVFNGAKGQCAACHKIGYVGGLVGPDLTRVGGTRTPRDLLEAIVFPSASFVRSYEPVRVTTTDGRVLNGLLAADTADEVAVAVAADRTERVPRADVEAVAPGTVSVMPAGLDQQLTRQELADLVAFLRACR
ncbi:PVC-type heme-binding CxxCH protein [Urbifossiella limnaea]|uniref:Cytochrome c n=1 Tax=Urbifossiella limnaea TaxID=2528023 RepID=A0A517XNR1_9BACT|nr:PVC-type heme-binding CxxCH protein [Urbifossiella limnaea]QDU19151.1 Cytochrome c [Urbifossiella limnaea]